MEVIGALKRASGLLARALEPLYVDAPVSESRTVTPVTRSPSRSSATTWLDERTTAP